MVLGHLRSNETSLVIAVTDGIPWIAHLGGSLGSSSIDPNLLSRGVVGGGLDLEVVPALIAQSENGWPGRPGVELRTDAGRPLPVTLTLADSTVSERSISMILVDRGQRVRVAVELVLEEADTVVVRTRLDNIGPETVSVDALRVCIPIGAQAREVLTLGGRHAMEAIQQRTPWGRSVLTVENRSGRTSHENLGVVFAGTPGFGEQHGHVWGVHAAWSGNFEITCDGVSENLRTISVGELLRAGEVMLRPGDSHLAPDVVISHSASGLNGVSRRFHDRVRNMHGPEVSRPVILNTWEAVYFEHDLDTLKRLADIGASVGVERFVLDDGWFHGRRNDRAGLGDWWVDKSVWPDGLTPLVDHVRGLGMEFGLWFEPEMVNPDSQLFREHPDWALGGTDSTPILGRHQLVLDLSREEVRNHLFHQIHEILSTHDISFVKWDHNRPIVGGLSAAQTRGTYELFDRLTRAHANVQFESCASGGGRIDHGIARHVRRFWASDSIDALDRLEIQRGLSLLMPPEVLGSHIGSPVCHTTGRRHALSFRAATAMFGWLGIEWNLLDLDERDVSRLASVISVYKQFRPLIHGGDHFRSDHPDDTLQVHGVTSRDRSQALVSISRIESGPSNRTAPLLVPGLSADAAYSVRLVDLGRPRWALHRQLPAWVSSGATLTGAQFARLGLEIPPLLPESSIVLHITESTTR